MQPRLFHIFRNTPFGRETLLQSIYFCKATGERLYIYIPTKKQFMLYVGSKAIQVGLDSSYLSDPGTAEDHCRQILDYSGFTADFFQPEEYTASTLPDVHLDYEYLCCPRIISDLSTKIGLGQIGTKVRQILKEAPFPVLIPSQVYKPWKSITVFFGGSESAKSALLFAASLAGRAEVPCRIFTQDEGKGRESYADQIREQLGEAWSGEYEWKFFTQGSMRDNLFEVEHDTLAVMGIFGHPPLKKALFGSTMELIQSHLPNSLLLVGDKCCFPGG
ncbi:MAG: universal stress protein [Desulfonatronovibrionaceae bacterium]